MTKELSDERVAFEVWALKEGFDLIRHSNEAYANQNLDHDWVVWQAAIAHKSEGALPAKDLCLNCGDRRGNHTTNFRDCTNGTSTTFRPYESAAPAVPGAVPVYARSQFEILLMYMVLPGSLSAS